MKKNNPSLTAKTSFLNQLSEYGLLKVLNGLDFKIAVLFLVVYYFDAKFNLNYLIHDNENSIGFITTIIGASSILFALTITSLSLILSFSSSTFVKFLQKHNQLSPILFLFWIGNGAYLLSIGLSMIYFILNDTKFPSLHNYLFMCIVGVFIYALVNTFYLLATIIRFGYFMSAFDEESQE